jgi:hypothetical protein
MTQKATFLLNIVRRISHVNHGIFDMLGTSIALPSRIADCDFYSMASEDHCI